MQQINTAILSFGMSGQVFHGPFIHLHPGFHFYAVWERSKNESQKEYPGVKIYRTLEELLADAAIELVIVNTPNYTHFEYAKKALQAGKHVIIEKPFVTTVAEGEELISLAAQNNLFLSVYQNRRYDSDFKTVKKIFESGCLGEVIEAAIHFDRFKEELSPKLHKEHPGPGAGILYDLGPHIIDQALHLFGRPEAVFADIRILRPQSKVDDYFEILLYYPRIRVRLHASYYVREPLPSFVLYGTRGTFLKHRADVQEKALLEGKRPRDVSSWGIEPEAAKGWLHTELEGQVVQKAIPTEHGNYMAYFDGIYKAIRDQKPLPVTATEALDVIKVIQTAFQSSVERRVLPI